ARLTNCIRKGDTVSRSGGDEFILVMPELSHPQDAALVAEKIIRALNEPIVIREHQLSIGVSIGIAVYPIDGPDDTHELMKKADMAMYTAKESGRNNYRFYGEAQRP
ncbi:MAG TPA: GGDEF domain-containing protein, partial [Gallionella sp.]|nr:GGDEF domain-containing protein [Gallionella sp.]